MPEMTDASMTPAAIRTQLRALTAAPAFRESERHRRLLEFLVESTLRGEAEGLKEFVIATEVWGRDVSFDPRIHSTVRVEVGRLRSRLKKYYAGQGALDPIRFRIPVGGYAVMFEAWAEPCGDSGSPEDAKDESRFELVELIGRGGMGEVWSAHDRRLQRQVALKFISMDFARNQSSRDSFEREARAAAALNHPNICTIYDVGEISGQPFLAMELLEGQTMEHRLAEQGVPVDSLVDWGIEIADALETAHSKGIVHSDLKPGNLFLTTRGQTKILDFGLARLATERNDRSERKTAGTPGYMSPEQIAGSDLDARSDLFSLGIVLYRAATGRLPERLPGPPSSYNRQVPPELDRIIAKTLEPDREVRYQHASELRADLKRLKRDSGPQGVASAPDLPAIAEPRSHKRLWLALGIVAGVLLAVAGGLLWSRSRQPRLAGNGTIVLADFANSTGDPVFDSALREGMAAQLQQSPYLGILSDTRISQTLQLMMQPKDAKLTADVAREVCQRTGSAAAIEGSIAKLGSQYVLGLKALECKSGNILAQDQETADSKEHVLNALGTAVSKLRRKLGESIESQQRYNTPLEDVTTGSLDALQAFSLGTKAASGDDFTAACKYYERAVTLDPNFAMAYGKLGNCLAATSSGEEYTRKAYLLRDHVSDREQFYLAAHYEQIVTGDLDATRKLLETWAQTYPHDGEPAPNLLKLYLGIGEYEKALSVAQQIAHDSPGTPVNNAYQLATTLIYLNRLDDAKAVLQAPLADHPDAPVLHYFLYEIAFLQADRPAMAKEAALVASKSGWTGFIKELEDYTAASEGRFAQSRVLADQAAEDARRAGNLDEAAGYLAGEAEEDALAGNLSSVGKRAKDGLALSKAKDVDSSAAIALALSGDKIEATRILNDLNKRFPKDTLVQVSLATIRACILLGDGKSPQAARQAVDALAGNSRYDANGAYSFVQVYIRGRAYLAAGQSTDAAREFQKILDHPGVARNYPTGSLARLGLAEAEDQAGDTAKARADYAAFLALWHDADPDLPTLKAAKTAYARLSATAISGKKALAN